ncbi:MAG: CoA ester lyase, partial [Pseudomonadota bacterium]
MAGESAIAPRQGATGPAQTASSQTQTVVDRVSIAERAADVRSFLFVPGTRPDRFDKALQSGADMVCVDLEDAVAPPLKEGARAGGVAYLSGHESGPLRALRINPLSTPEGMADLLAVAKSDPNGILVLPKVDSAVEVRLAASVLAHAGTSLPLAALVESAEGLANVHAIAAEPSLVMVIFGAVDLAAELGAELSETPMLFARSQVVHAARRAGVSAIDVPSLNFRDLDAVGIEAAAARALGFTGKAMIHPTNVAPIHAAFTPSDDEVARARTIVAAYRDSPTGLAVVDGKLVEAPVVKAA